ncbi:Sec63 domain [Dillenia turbinata]|uniref:RNA helicase n=1 Tax=Dillenia turbinata TaxID=194707 RepID=A0AAN8V9B4_9MAGN
MLIQLPRLTNSLREPVDVDQAFLERKIILQSHNSRSSANSLEESELARIFVGRWDEASVELRQTYKQYIAALVELIDDEVVSEQFREVALSVYNLFGNSLEEYENDERFNEKRLELQRLLGHAVSDASLRKVASFAQRLFVWQSKDQGKAVILHKQINGGDCVEFGSDLEFEAPARFIVDVSLEDGELLGVEGPSSSLSAYDGGHAPGNSAQFHSAGDGGNLDLRWLRDACDRIVKGSTSQLSSDELAMAICRVLDTDKPGDEIAGDLLDLVGDDAFETVQDLLLHRKELVDAIHHGLLALKSDRTASNTASRMPSYGTQVIVQTETERQNEKLRRKEEKKHRRGAEHDIDRDLYAGSFSSLLEASERKSPFDDIIGTGQGPYPLSAAALPQGTVRKHHKGYEEVIIPPTSTAQMKPGERLIEIKELDDFAKVAFHGYKSLNRIQSQIFQTTYYTNENILVCAPTGAGKTNIAMIAILHEIVQHFKDGYLHKDEFKIVYVAPMKALAAEVTSTFSYRLAPLNVTVKELTGDMQLSKSELEETQMIVTTPEKWDVITRKSSDMSLSMLVKLLIIDEVHLLNDDRGSVIEALVARTLRQVESTQTMIRIVGLSATLPSYKEVAQFLRVNPETGLFFFDSSYRPVPLAQQYIGISEPNFAARTELLNEICYKKVVESLHQGHQAMVFVHSRKDTGKTAAKLIDLARKYEELDLFSSETHPQFSLIKKDVQKSRNRELVELFESGIGIHHAGMLRADRGLTERLFSDGLLKVLVCTATLAWGVNLPAHTVVIKGTQLYDPKAGGWRDLGMLDVMQIFGRAGRPQFDKSGEGIIITSHDKLAYYLRLLTSQLPIESQILIREDFTSGICHSPEMEMLRSFNLLVFLKVPIPQRQGWANPGGVAEERRPTLHPKAVWKSSTPWRLKVKVIPTGFFYNLIDIDIEGANVFISSLKDNLNAEVALGTVTNVKEACAWLGYTYLFIRMRINPLAYGIRWEEVIADPSLSSKQRALVTDAARALDKAKMMRFDEKSGNFYCTELGRIASHFYIQYSSVETYNEMLRRHMSDSEVINVVAHSTEFENIVVREEEQSELEMLARTSCPLEVKGGPSNKHGKISILIQLYISRGSIDAFSLVSDAAYISASLARIMRALFEICLRRGWCEMTSFMLEYCKAVDRQIWPHQHPLRQFDRDLPADMLRKLEDWGVDLDHLLDMEEKDIGALIRYAPGGKLIKQYLGYFPCIQLSATVSPITRTVLKVDLLITPDFIWKDRFHGAAERWWILVELKKWCQAKALDQRQGACETCDCCPCVNNDDSENDHIYHSDLFTLTKKMARGESQKLSFTVPIFEPHPPQYYVRAVSDSWLQAEAIYTISLYNLALPMAHTSHTELLDLKPLPVTALRNKTYETLYNFSHFNPIQTQIFHILYHTDNNVLLGAPTGSGKTISAELAMLRLFNTRPDMKVLSHFLKHWTFYWVLDRYGSFDLAFDSMDQIRTFSAWVVYIAPLKAIVRERMSDWRKRLVSQLGKEMVEMTGDYTPDLMALLSADIIISTPEKWDGISRNWQSRSYVKKVGLMILDEIHLLGADRGPILEVIVSRMRYISSQTERAVRFVGLSTALANACDLADWLGVEENGLFNFKPSVRPVPLEVHIQITHPSSPLRSDLHHPSPQIRLKSDLHLLCSRKPTPRTPEHLLRSPSSLQLFA